LLIESLLRSVRQVSLTSWAALVFLIGPFLSILIAPFCLLGFERFGVQWHVLLLSCLGAAALVVPQAGFFPFVKRLLASRRVSASVAVFVVWLLVMGFVHGFAAQAESLLSAAMLLLMLPIGLYVALDPYRQWSIGDLALALLLLIVVLENIFLSSYFLRGLDLNQVYMNVIGSPRLFLNVRDGNFLALTQSQLLVLFFFGRENRCLDRQNGCDLWVAFVGFMAFQPFFNAWLTQGRALLLCLFMAIALLFWYGVRRRSRLHCTIGAISLGSGILAFAAYMMLRLQVSVSSGAAGLASLVDRADGGRFELWRVWLESGLSHSIWWGHGLGFLPELRPGANFTPHSFLIQLIADGGAVGALMLVAMILISLNLWRLDQRQVLAFDSVLFVFLFGKLASIAFWPSGVWAWATLILSVVLFLRGSFLEFAEFPRESLLVAKGNALFSVNAVSLSLLFSVFLISVSLAARKLFVFLL
jgi:hypothetical protein